MIASTRPPLSFPNVQSAVWAALQSQLGQALRAMRDWQASRQNAAALAAARASLQALSDRELRDLGITRDQIREVVGRGRPALC